MPSSAGEPIGAHLPSSRIAKRNDEALMNEPIARDTQQPAYNNGCNLSLLSDLLEGRSGKRDLHYYLFWVVRISRHKKSVEPFLTTPKCCPEFSRCAMRFCKLRQHCFYWTPGSVRLNTTTTCIYSANRSEVYCECYVNRKTPALRLIRVRVTCVSSAR